MLARSDLVEGAPLRFHPHVGVAREHGARDVPRDAHDHFVARSGLGDLPDERVPVIAEQDRPGGLSYFSGTALRLM
jgi:hypothetical protein